MWLTLVLVASVTSAALDTAINNSVAAGVTFVVEQEIQEKMHPHGPLLATQTLSL